MWDALSVPFIVSWSEVLSRKWEVGSQKLEDPPRLS